MRVCVRACVRACVHVYRSIMDVRFIRGATHLVVGPSGSGKTFRVLEYLKLKNELFQDGPKIKNVVFYYAAAQPVYDEMRKKNLVTTFKNMLPTNDDFIDAVHEYKDRGGSIVIIDDFMADINKDLEKIVTVTSRHYNTSTFILHQNLFPKQGRQISLNVKYIHLLKNPRENAQFATLARQLQPHNWRWIVEAYHEATKNPYSCFLIDVTQETPEVARFRSNVLEKEWPMQAWMSKGVRPRDLSATANYA